MARFKVHFVLNRGRHGAPMAKLGRISEQAEKFLRALAADCQVVTHSGEWLAVNFNNGSVEYDAEFQGDVNAGDAQAFVKRLEFLADFDAENDDLNGSISHGATIEFARLGALIDPDEVIGLGIYPVHGGKPRWRDITYSRTASLRREVETPLPAYGSVQGILHAWFKEAKEPNFQVRELSTDSIIRVTYPSNLYSDVARAVQERTTMLVVTGDILYSQVTRQAMEMHADGVKRMTMLSTAEFEEFFGSAPEFMPDFDSDDQVEEVF